MSSTQVSFALRTSSSVKTVHLLGSWDGYVGQLPLSKDKTSSKSGSWKGTFRFQSTVLQAGQRHWYYFIVDGYHCAHNPSETSTVEPTTGRTLNILDVKGSKSSKSSKSSSKSSSSSSKHSSSRSGRHSSSSRRERTPKVEIPKGRPLSVSEIKSPKPVSPGATRNILNSDVACEAAIEELTARFGSADIEEEFYYDDHVVVTGSPVSSSTSSSLSYRSAESSSSLSGYSTPASDCSSCTCERYGITRKGDRVRIDCGGVRCGFSDSDECSSAEEDDYVPTPSRRNGMVVRA